ncbi:MAG: LamG domain-containing protein, partial [Planctomycetota bacterium]
MYKKLFFLVCIVGVLGLAGKVRAELVARYSFDDGTASDSSYYYEDAEGTFYGDAKVVDDPCRGLALDLDGSGDYVKVLNSEVANFSTESFTFSFWAQCSTLSSWYYFWRGTVFDGLKGVNCFHDVDSGEVRFTLYYPPEPGVVGKARVNVPDANFVTGKWIHIACMRDADVDELRLYVNGELEPPAADSSNPQEDTVKNISNTGQLYIGADDRTGPTDFFLGRIDDFRVYNHALSEEELERLAGDYVDPNLASDPNPEDGAQDECNDLVLSWTAGDNAVTHNVYFGTGDRDVRDANTLDPEFRLNQPGTAYNAGLLESLQPGVTYFWRIDEVKPGHPHSPWKGDVWKFKINDGKAHSPDPADEARMVPLDEILSWGAGCHAASHDVYFSTDFDDVNEGQPAAFQGNQGLEDTDFDPNEWDPCGLDYSTFYYWRIDEINDTTTWEGDVWSFKTKSAIDDPNLRVRYKFDETAGTIAADSSGREYDGDLSGEVSWDADGHDDGCLLFDEGHVVVPTPVLGEIDKEITICAWLNNSVSTGENVVLAAGAAWEDFYLRVAVPDDGTDVYWRAGDEANDVMEWKGGNPRAWQGSWNHFAVVKDEDDAKMEIYLNGVEVAVHAGLSSGTLANIRNRRIRIGAESFSDGDYEGKIDDFRVYDRALSADEIGSIFRGGDLGIAWAPHPFDGELDVPRDVVLNWRPGDYAVSHEVYFGTDFDDVNDANTSSGVFIDNWEPNEYDPPGFLELDTTYYWRIDEVNDSNADSPWKGKVWQFTVANFLIVDDVESYNAISGSGNEIFDTWDDGFMNWTGSQIALEYSGGPTHGGEQSMKVQYDNAIGLYKYSEVDANTTGPRPGNLDIGVDWTIVGVEALTVFFYGTPGNDANEQMYVALTDNSNNMAISRY